MWVLIMSTCLALQCTEIKVIGVYSSEPACVEAMKTIEIEHGFYGCIRKEPEEVKT